jgi:anaerobic selenocysteine-containing dehydrogenase
LKWVLLIPGKFPVLRCIRPKIIANSRGEVTLKAKLGDAVRQGILYTPKGAWLKASDAEQTVNPLISADLKTDIMDGACYKGTFVDIAVVQV